MYIQTAGAPAGSGRPALALIHGWAMHAGLFAPLVERLGEAFTLHLVDLPGHGYAREDATPLDPKALAADLVQRIPDAHWLGWSLGGQVALRAGLDHADRVRGLILIASSPRFVVGDDWPHGVQPSLFRNFGEALGRDFRGTLEGFLALEALGSAKAQEELRHLRQLAFERGDPAPRALQEGLVLLDEFDVRAELPRLRVPSLWISGRRDRLVPAGAMPAAAALAPRGRSEVIASAGHAPFLGATDEVAASIEAFVAQAPAPAVAV
ncbi:pimeloyl-ACP methyl ester esterase BioH [Lysobacter enzymogenes]|uniref:pimeloyl-ACP methyl ester esterase BioH n=1 Tax=Lysobacter enzymogenes TaxID=69 RepID=UPI001AFC5329|nr:pimeloyl-ACP methyl ester esterase BioH [Lysobacter enzymogenes]QQQ01257.1 pimeloyl-ACP methyl ester esterase BioH [Lysobacter enzymogenes]